MTGTDATHDTPEAALAAGWVQEFLVQEGYIAQGEEIKRNVREIARQRDAAVAEIARLRAALVQAHERMDVAWNVMHPGDLTVDEREVIAQALWFGMEELDALDPSEP